MIRGWLQRHGDLLLAVAFLAVATIQIAGDGDLRVADRIGAVGVAVAVAVAIWQRRQAPLVLAGVTLASIIVRPVIPVAGDGVAYGFPVVLAAYTCAAWLEGWALRLGAALTFAMGIGVGIADAESVDLASLIFFATFLGIPWIAGRAMRLSRQRQALLEEHAVLLEAQRDEQARAAVVEERQRIARELHDVVAHAISVVVLQARGGRALLESEPMAAREAFDTIERTSTQALGEMRRLLGLLRADDEHSLVPQPTLGHVEALAEELRSSGLPVEVSVEGEPGALPPGVDVSAYRIVQEALTNALKHAGPARVRVRIAYETDSVLVEVIDDGVGANTVAARSPTPGSGHGLVGIRERVAIVGGEVNAGPRPTGGYAVSARLPYSAER